MSITNRESLGFLKVVGWFFIIVLVAKLYFKGEYTLEVLLTGGLISIPLIAMVSWFWQHKLSYQKIESSFGSLFFTKKTVYTNLQSIELSTSHVDVKGGGDYFLLSIAIKVSGRKEPVCLLIDFDKSNDHEIVSVVKEVSKVTGVSSINVSEHFNAIYQERFNKEFSLS